VLRLRWLRTTPSITVMPTQLAWRTQLPPYSFILILKTYTAKECAMSRTTTMTVRLSGALSEFVAANVGEDGSYENVSEYIRDLIRRDKERAEKETFDRLKTELRHAFSAPESSYKPLTAAEVIARNRT